MKKFLWLPAAAPVLSLARLLSYARDGTEAAKREWTKLLSVAVKITTWALSPCALLNV